MAFVQIWIMKTAKCKFAPVFFTIFISVLLVFSFLTIKTIMQKRSERLPDEFRAAITHIKYKHGSSYTAFIDLSNGHQYLFTLPRTNITAGDSIIKIKNEPFFRVRKASGQEVGKISLNGNLYKE